MVAKIITHANSRSEAIARMRRALEETHVSGVKTNLGLLYMTMLHPQFIDGSYDTGFIESNLDKLLAHIGAEMQL